MNTVAYQIDDEMKAVCVNALAAPLKTGATEEVRAQLETHVKTAAQLIDRHIGTAYVPREILTEAIIIAAGELHTRRKSPGGVFAAFGDQEAPIRLARDPLTLVYPLLRPFLPLGIA